MIGNQQAEFMVLCQQLDHLAGAPISSKLAELFRRMDSRSLESYREDLQVIFTYQQKSQ